jgi:hypothetical protein
MFRPMWSSSGVKIIIGRENCFLLFLLMLLIYVPSMRICVLEFENKTRSTTQNKRERNPPTQPHMRIEGAQATTEDNTFLAQ